MKQFVKIFLAVIAIVVLLIALAKCSKNASEIEAEEQIENASRLSGKPTYFVESVSANEESDIIDILLRREAGKADGTLDSLINVSFYKEYTPSVEYIKTGDSIKLDILTEISETLIDGRYQQSESYECYLYVFVDQLPTLIQKSKEME